MVTETIRANLPKGMDIRKNNCNGPDINLFDITYDNTIIGDIKIYSSANDDLLSVDVKIDDSNYEHFVIDNPLHVYLIINSILTKYNFD